MPGLTRAKVRAHVNSNFEVVFYVSDFWDRCILFSQHYNGRL
jgi:hypothetical protein